MKNQSEYSEGSFLIAYNLFLGAILVSAFLANLLVLLVFYRKRGLRTVANRFVINLMAMNMLTCMTLLPLSMVDNGATATGRFLCIATELSVVFCSSVTIYAVLLIALDQYCAVVEPLHYHRVINSTKSTWMIVSSWLLSAVFAIGFGIQPSIDGSTYSVFRSCGRETFNATEPAEPIHYDAARIYRVLFSVVFAVSVFIVPYSLICFIYSKIYAAASGNNKRTRTSCVSTDENVHNTGARERADVPGRAGYVAVADKETGDDEQRAETCGLLTEHANPSFVLTRPSPPRDEAKAADAPFLKPTLKNNASFSKLSSLHIQFSCRTEEIALEGVRRHSNVSAPPIAETEFNSVGKCRSSSLQANAFEMRAIQDATDAPLQQTSASHARSSRSSSINSSSVRNPASRASSIRSTSSYIVHNIRHRISNASLFRYREDARAAKISALVIVMALVCWLPFFTVFCLRSAGLRHTFAPAYLDYLSLALLLLSALVSPFLFAVRNRKIKKEIRKILRRCRANLGADCAKSFYKHNFTFDARSHLFPGLAQKKSSAETSPAVTPL